MSHSLDSAVCPAKGRPKPLSLQVCGKYTGTTPTIILATSGCADSSASLKRETLQTNMPPSHHCNARIASSGRRSGATHLGTQSRERARAKKKKVTTCGAEAGENAHVCMKPRGVDIIRGAGNESLEGTAVGLDCRTHVQDYTRTTLQLGHVLDNVIVPGYPGATCQKRSFLAQGSPTVNQNQAHLGVISLHRRPNRARFTNPKPRHTRPHDVLPSALSPLATPFHHHT